MPDCPIKQAFDEPAEGALHDWCGGGELEAGEVVLLEPGAEARPIDGREDEDREKENQPVSQGFRSHGVATLLCNTLLHNRSETTALCYSCLLRNCYNPAP